MKALRFLVILLVLTAFAGNALAIQPRREVMALEKKSRNFSPLKKRQLESIPAPVEPVIPQVDYLKIEPAGTLRERVDRLLSGIKVDIAPEYDHYGYELRRYMAHIAGPEVLGDPERLVKEFKNTEKAMIILNYWQQELNKEIYEIEKAISADKVGGSDLMTTQATFKHNRSIVSAFLVECEQWIQHNQEMLRFLMQKSDVYTYEDPVFIFDEGKDRLKFTALYEAREKAFSYIIEYPSFSMMVY